MIARGQQPTHLPANVGTNVPILEVGDWDQTKYRVACTQKTENYKLALSLFLSLCVCVCMCITDQICWPEIPHRGE